MISTLNFYTVSVRGAETVSEPCNFDTLKPMLKGLVSTIGEGATLWSMRSKTVSATGIIYRGRVMMAVIYDPDNGQVHLMARYRLYAFVCGLE